MLDVGDDADNLAPRRLFFSGAETGPDPLPDRILSGEIRAREAVVHDRDARRGVVVREAEITTPEKRHPHGVKVSRAHHPEGRGQLLGRWRRRSGQLDAEAVTAAAQWQRRRGRNRLDTGNGRDVRQQFVVERDLFQVRIARVRQPESGGDHVLRIESRRRVEQPVEVAQQQPRGDEQHHADRRLRDHEARADALLRTSSARTHGRLQPGGEIGARRLKRRNHPEGHRAANGHQYGEGENRTINRRLVEPSERDR